MSKIVHGFRLSSPDASGFPDKVRVFNGSIGDMLVYESLRYRTNPNPYQPSTLLPWNEVYAQIAPTDSNGIPWTCVETPKHGKCIALNDEGPVPTLAPDPNNGGKMFALAVLIHMASAPKWPGSMACQTVHMDDWTSFISHFTLGEKGVYILTDEQQAPDDTVIIPQSTFNT